MRPLLVCSGCVAGPWCCSHAEEGTLGRQWVVSMAPPRVSLSP